MSEHAPLARAERIKRILITATAAAVALILGLMLVLMGATYRVLAIVEDCTNPAGECAQRGQKSTSTAVASINEISAYAAVCADRPGSQSLAEIRACIADLIEASR